MTLEPGLYVAATPIGNLQDASFRLVETLKSADLILCEDTRQTGKLCQAFDIRTPLKPYHDHNGAQVRPKILEDLTSGAAICLVSDAGTPLISDPGFKLVREARDAGVDVIALPGPCAAIAALSIAGAPSNRFMFAGFPPSKAAARLSFFKDLAHTPATLIFYETGPRLGDSLAAMNEVFTVSSETRTGIVARELTKRFEETVEGSLDELAKRYQNAPPKGEIVVIINPPSQDNDAIDLDEFIANALEKMTVKDAAAAAADALGVPRKDAYATAIRLAKAK